MTKRKAGRPRTARDGGVRQQRQVRFTDAEWAQILRLARQEGVTAAELIRRRVLPGSGRT